MKAMMFLLSLSAGLNTMALAQTACPQGVTPGSSRCLPTGVGGSAGFIATPSQMEDHVGNYRDE